MKKLSFAALRAHWPSTTGVFLTIFLATAIVAGAAALVVSGVQAEDRFSPTATLLPAMMTSFGGVAVMIAVFVVSTAVAGALRDRRREFALLRAVGADSRQVRSLVTREVMVVAGCAVVVGSIAGYGAAYALVPLLRRNGLVEAGFMPSLSAWPLVVSAALLLPAAFAASRLAAREMARLNPTATVGAASVDKSTLGAGRIMGAWICAAFGVASILTPLFVPGMFGAAMGAMSAILLITAVALAGPAIIARGAAWAAGRGHGRRLASIALATANARGFSRRLTAVVVPLALLVALGAVQSGTDNLASQAAREQLADAVAGDLVWVGDPADAGAVTEQLAAVPGVGDVAVIHDHMVQVRLDESDEEMPFLSGFAWEPAIIRSVTQPDGTLVFDPGVTRGSLADLATPGTVAASTDVLFGTGKGVGDTIDVRDPDGAVTTLTIIALYERGMGVGPFITGPAGVDGINPAPASATVVVRTDAGDAAAVGLATVSGLMDVDEYVATAAQNTGDNLSLVLLLALLAFVGIAAGNSLVLATRGRREEFVLLSRIGATRRQVRSMLGVEAGLVAVGAVGIGTVVALPGLVMASVAMVDGFSLGLDPVLYGGLVATAVLTSFLCVLGARPLRRLRHAI